MKSKCIDFPLQVKKIIKFDTSGHNILFNAEGTLSFVSVMFIF